MYICVYTYVHMLYTHKCIYDIHIHTYICAHTHMCVYTYKCKYFIYTLYSYLYCFTSMYIFISIYLHFTHICRYQGTRRCQRRRVWLHCYLESRLSPLQLYAHTCTCTYIIYIYVYACLYYACRCVDMLGMYDTHPCIGSCTSCLAEAPGAWHMHKNNS